MSHNLEWTDSLLKVTSRDSPSATSGIHYDLSTFLSIVLKSRINILAAMWNAMSAFSHGGTANIRQWIVNVETTLAFKRTSRLFILHPSWVAYKALISEVLILGSPAVHGHPNIVNLEAVSWEIVDGGDVRPVLVFEKAQRQDMGAFLKSKEGREISFDARMSLCKHIAHGLMLLHRSNIVHGDLKPENVLIFTNDSGYTAKVTDFGYSCFGASEDDVVYLPYSQRWAAPEYTATGLALRDAKKSDLYSYGLLCWYILFQKYFNDPDNVSPKDPEDEGLRHPTIHHNAESSPDCLKQKLGQTTDERFPGTTEEHKSILLEFFQSTLSTAATRCSDFMNLIACLDRLRSSAVSDFPPKLVEAPKLDVSALEHADFSVAELILPLISMDYRVRNKTKKAIEARYSGSCKTCLSKAALQLAVCYKLGFGDPADEDKATELLKQSGYDIAALEHQITVAKNQKLADYEGETLRKLGQMGSFPTYTPWEHSGKDQSMKEIKEIYEREIADLKAVLGSIHPVIDTLQWDLCLTFQADGDFGAAERILKDQSKTEHEHGIDHPVTKIGLATTYWYQGKWNKAEKLLLEAMVPHVELHNFGHLSNLTVKSYLASIYRKQFRLEEAKELFDQVRSTNANILGEEHPDTIKAMVNLATTYGDQCRWEKAEELLAKATDISTRVLGKEHPDTLSSLNYLALAYRKQDRLKEAQAILVDLQDITARVLGKNHPDSLTCMDNLAMTYRHSRQFEDAEQLEWKVMATRTTVLGEGHPDTLNSMYNLALIYRDQKRLVDAEILLLDVVKADLGDDGLVNQNALFGMEVLGVTYLDLQRWDDAEEWFKQAIDAALKQPNSQDSFLLDMKGNLASAYSAQQRWEKAAELYDQIFQAKKNLLCQADPDIGTITIMSNLSWAYINLGQWKDAERLLVPVVERRKKLLGLDHPDTLRSMQCLVYSYRCQELKENAEAVEAEVREVTRTRKR